MFAFSDGTWGRRFVEAGVEATPPRPPLETPVGALLVED
jgi:hypothetical protein